MNNDWIRQKLEEFLALCEQYEAESDPGGDYNRATMKPIQDRIDDAVPTVQCIIGQLDPSLLSDGFGTAWHIGGLSETARTTRRALAVLRDREELRINLASDSPSAEEVDVPNNPAGRVRSFLTACQSLVTQFAEAQDLPNDSAAAIIAEVLHVEAETGRFHMQLARLYMEAESVPELVAPNAGDSAYRNFFKNYSQILTVMEGLQDPSHKDYSVMLNGLDHKGWAALEYAEDVLSQHSIEVPITDELARSYLDQLRALIDEIAKDDELSSQDRSRVVGLLRKVEEALLDIRIIGTLPVQDAAAAAAAMAHAPGIRERIMGKSWVEAFLTTVRGIVIVLQGADSGMAIAQDVQKMITG